MGLKRVPTFTKEQLEWRLLRASDSDWANDKDNRKSAMAFILFLCGFPILRCSKQASIVALSTAEADYIALSELAREIVFVVQILHSIGIPVKTQITIHRTHHIDVKHRLLVDLTEEDFFDAVFTNSANNTSDGLSKNVSKEACQRHTPKFTADKSILD